MKVATFSERMLIEQKGALEKFATLLQQALGGQVSHARSESQLLQAKVPDAKKRKFYLTLSVYRSGTVYMQFPPRTPRESVEATVKLVGELIESAVASG